MDKDQLTKKFKEGVSVQELEEFVKKYTTQLFSVLALIIATVSGAFDFFSGPKMTLLFLSIGALLGMFFSGPVENGLRQMYGLLVKQEKTTEMILGGVKIVIALFIPFIYFGGLGLLAGTAFRYYVRQAQMAGENRPKKPRQVDTGEEHD